MLLKNINLEELRPTIPLNLNVILFSLLLYIVHCVPICFLVERDTFIFNLSVLAQSVLLSVILIKHMFPYTSKYN